MGDQEPKHRKKEDVDEDQRPAEKRGGSWADEAAKARTADDPRARTPSDSAGQPSTRSLDE